MQKLPPGDITCTPSILLIYWIIKNYILIATTSLASVPYLPLSVGNRYWSEYQTASTGLYHYCCWAMYSATTTVARVHRITGLVIGYTLQEWHHHSSLLTQMLTLSCELIFEAAYIPDQQPKKMRQVLTCISHTCCSHIGTDSNEALMTSQETCTG